MRLVQTVSLSRSSAPAFLPLTQSEAVRLRHVPAWMRWLYWELVGLADFKTGEGRTSWAQLVALLDYDKPERGRRAAEEIGAQRIRRAFDELAALGLVWRDKGTNEARQWLFFSVSPRTGLGASKRKTDRVSDRVKTGTATRENAPAVPANSTGNSTGGSGTIHKATRLADLSTGHTTPQPEHTRPPAELLAAVRARRGGEKRAPQGAGQSSPSGNAPQGLRPSKPAHAGFSPAPIPQQMDDAGKPARPATDSGFARRFADCLAIGKPLLNGELGKDPSPTPTGEAPRRRAPARTTHD